MKIQGDAQLLDGGQLLSARVENLGADPISPYAGQVWFNTTDGHYKGYTGTTIMQFATGGALGDYLSKAGGTMTGSLILSGAPTADLEAATKKYVDDADALKQATITGAATTIVAANLSTSKALVSDVSGKVAASTVTATELGYVSGVTSSIQTQIDAQVAVAGDTMTGALVLFGAPTADLEAATKKYVDDADALKQATITGAATTIVAADLTASRAVVSDVSGKVAASTVTSAELGYVSGVTSSIQTQIDAQVAVAGDTMTGALLMGANKITSSYTPIDAVDLVNKAYSDSQLAHMNWQEDVLAVQVDAVLDPGATPAFGDRYIITAPASLHSNFGTITGVGVDDIVVYNGTAFEVAFDISVEGTLAEGTLAWSVASAAFVRYVTSWTEFAGLNSLNAGVGLSKSVGSNIINVNLGAGVAELPTDEVGIDVYSAGGLFLTVDGSTASTATAAQLAILINGSTLSSNSSGIQVAAAGVTETQLATSVAGGGLTGGAGTALAVGAGTGITVNANDIAIDTTWADARYINTAGDTLTGALTLSGAPTVDLHASTKKYVDDAITSVNGTITTLSDRVDAGFFVYTSIGAATTHTVTHGIGQQYVNVTIVDMSNQVVIPQSITFNSTTQLTVVFNATIDCRVITAGVQPAV